MKAAGGLTLLPCWLGDSDPELERIIAPPGPLSEDVYLLTRRDSRGSTPVGAVLQGLVQLFKTHAAALAGRES